MLEIIGNNNVFDGILAQLTPSQHRERENAKVQQREQDIITDHLQGEISSIVDKFPKEFQLHNTDRANYMTFWIADEQYDNKIEEKTPDEFKDEIYPLIKIYREEIQKYYQANDTIGDLRTEEYFNQSYYNLKPWEMTSEQYVKALTKGGKRRSPEYEPHSVDDLQYGNDKDLEQIDVFPTEKFGDIGIYRSTEVNVDNEGNQHRSKSFYAKHNDKTVAFIVPAFFGGSELIVAEEYQGVGIGKYLIRLFQDLFPYYPSGGLTYGGEGLIKALHKDYVDEAIARGENVPQKVLREYGYYPKVAQLNKEPWQMTSDEYVQSIKPPTQEEFAVSNFSREKEDVYNFTGESDPYSTMELVRTLSLKDMEVSIYRKERHYGLLFMAVYNDQVLGYIGAMQDVFDENRMMVKTLYVHPEYQHMGIGGALFGEISKLDSNPKTDELSYQGMMLRKKYHRQLVEKAIEEGKDVPQEVLDEYNNTKTAQIDNNELAIRIANFIEGSLIPYMDELYVLKNKVTKYYISLRNLKFDKNHDAFKKNNKSYAIVMEELNELENLYKQLFARFNRLDTSNYALKQPNSKMKRDVSYPNRRDLVENIAYTLNSIENMGRNEEIYYRAEQFLA